MDVLPTRLDAPAPESVGAPVEVLAPSATARRTARRSASRDGAALWSRLRPAAGSTLGIYLGSRVLLLIVAAINTVIQHAGFENELTNWDGFWYLGAAHGGYPNHVEHIQTTLGFFPLYPMLIWLLEHVLYCGDSAAALLISGAGGFVATLLVRRLAASWWDEEAGRRAAVLFAFFPGSVVFSMAYSEGLLIPLAAGCLVALSSRRYLLAGLLAAFATAVGPDALAIVPACVAALVVEFRSRGLHSREAWRAVVAPVLAPVGIIAFGAFLWIWTGSPFASLIAQHDGWGERTDYLALVRQGQTLAREISFRHFDSHLVNLNYVAGLLGAAYLLVALVLCTRRRARIPAPAVWWTLGIAFLAVTSEYTPPNPRLLLTAFPVVVVLGRLLHRRGYRIAVAVNTVLLVVMSAITFVGIALRP